MAKAIDTLLDDPELRTRFGRNGYLRVQKLYSDELYFERLVQLYERLSANGKGNSN
jgi:glycosyltransferase involved in cell wall biosynthesis